jgi:hypothetical protein
MHLAVPESGSIFGADGARTEISIHYLTGNEVPLFRNFRQDFFGLRVINFGRKEQKPAVIQNSLQSHPVDLSLHIQGIFGAWFQSPCPGVLNHPYPWASVWLRR